MAGLKKAGANWVDGDRASSTGGPGARTLKKAGALWVDGDRFFDREAELAVQPRPEQRAWSRIKSWLASVLRTVETVKVTVPGVRVTFRPKRDTTEE